MRQTNLAKADFCRHVSYFVQCLHRAGKIRTTQRCYSCATNSFSQPQKFVFEFVSVGPKIRFGIHFSYFQNSFWNSFFGLPEFVLDPPKIRFPSHLVKKSVPVVKKVPFLVHESSLVLKKSIPLVKKSTPVVKKSVLLVKKSTPVVSLLVKKSTPVVKNRIFFPPCAGVIEVLCGRLAMQEVNYVGAPIAYV